MLWLFNNTSHQCLQAQDVADAVMYALKAPPHVQVTYE